jgi:CDP-diacylglycerol---glycerol-3-phosphate 3-phosphatidyltransferase
LLRESKIGNWYLKWIEEIPVPFLSRLSFKPNHLTLSAFIISLLTVPAFLYSLWLGGLGILLAGVFDTLDGSLARKSNQKTRAGAFLDSVLDRYGDFLSLFGIWLYFLIHQESQLVPLTVVLFFTFLGSFMVSYTRARGEGLGLSMTEGMFGRAERVLSLGLGCILNDILIVFFPKPNWLGDHLFIISLLILLTLGTHWTAFQRIRYLTKNL